MRAFLIQLSMAVFAAFFLSCSAAKKATHPHDLEGMKHVELDTMMVTPEDGVAPDTIYPYRPTRERKWDLLHTALDLSFDWEKQNVIGEATLTLTPLFYPQDRIELDAVNFIVHSLLVNDKPVTAFESNAKKIIIPLTRTFTAGEEVEIEIQYTAHPEETEFDEGAAIYSDKGLFFIDPLDTVPGLARQIWTQGETSSSRKWYPTLDQPNERATQEITLTVPDSMMTLSNGALISSTPVAGGMRRDYWKLDLPHAPYLSMIAVGQWDKVTDYWRGRPVEYYVDPGYGDDARTIFAHTPEMLEFFSKKLDYTFVWPKYSQVVVKHFVSGAMENTTAVTFGDFVQIREEDMVEEGVNDYIVAHELFHHWFGDLVTCESWANITLNEGFANYAEYLWNEYKYGREKADMSRMAELSGYFDQAEREAHPLFYSRYASEGAIFDAHSYNKGGLVLHMMRDMIGDDAFFRALHVYLKKHQFSSVEIDDLRQAFEEVTGQDLIWFFDQWYYAAGHPALTIEHTFDAVTNTLSVAFHQTQAEKGFRDVFRLPVEIAICRQDTTLSIEKVWLEGKDQIFSFGVNGKPLAVIIDPRDILLAEVHHDIDPSEYPIRALVAPSISHRLSALRLMESFDEPLLQRLMTDGSLMVRATMVQYLNDQQRVNDLFAMGSDERVPVMQYYILETLRELSPLLAKDIAMDVLDTMDRIPVIYSGLKAIESVDLDEAVHQLAHFKDVKGSALYAARASILAKKGIGLSLDYFLTQDAAAIKDDYLEELIGAMALYLSSQEETIQEQGLQRIDSDFFLKTQNPVYRNFYLITGLVHQYGEEADGPYKDRLVAVIRSLYNNETDEYLKGVLKEGLGDLVD